MDGVVVLEKMKEKSKTVTLFGALFVVMVGVSYQLMKKREKGLELDVVKAEAAFHEWKNGKEDTFAGLESVLKKQSSLRTKYGTAIAQELIDRKEAKGAEPYFSASFERLSTETPYHRSYAKTTLLIGQKDYLAALVEARNLKDKLAQESRSNLRMLKAFNLLRIAFLEKQAGSEKGELAALKEFESGDIEAAHQVGETFKAEQLTLTDYIAHRKAALAKRRAN